MVTEGPAQELQDRREEREALERLLGAVRGGQSRVLVLSGEPGVGKTALLESVIGSASGFRAVRAVGVESEMELAFATLQQLCAPILDRLDRLPSPQRNALGVAFGLTGGPAHPAPDRPRCHPSSRPGRGERSPRPAPSTKPARSMRHSGCSLSPSPDR